MSRRSFLQRSAAIALGAGLPTRARAVDTEQPAADADDHFHTIKTDDLSVVIGDNTSHGEHRAGYHGIWRITSAHNSQAVFVPRYSGLNLNHIAPTPENDQLEPRQSPVELKVDVPSRQVTLHQPETRTTHVESWLTYTASGPHHIDWTYRYKLHDPALFKSNFAGFYLASYLDQPENKAIYVLSPSCCRAIMWIQYCPPTHLKDAAITWENDPYDLEFGPHDFLSHVNRAPITYHVPLYFGRLGNMLLANMFEEPKGVTICYGMAGGGFVPDQSDRNPAWDFFLYTKDPASHPEGQWRGRLVYKPFAGRDDVLDEYQRFQDALGRKWARPKYGPLAQAGE